jgi:signal transduction histidine kinase
MINLSDTELTFWRTYAAFLEKNIKEIRDTEIQAIASQIAASTAYEIRNPLDAAKGYIQLAMQNNEHKNLPDRYLKVALDEIDNAAKITSDFLSLVHPRKQDLQMMDINSLLSDMLLLVSNIAAMSDISIQNSLGEFIPACMMDARQVKQALLSVLRNALQSMPEGGLLSVTSSYSIQEEEICVTVSDTGEGITPENIDRVFNAFFSTRPEGLGLGLTLTNRIVQHHNGRVALKSIVGMGTTVFLYFPAQPKLEMYPPGFFRVSAVSPQKEGLFSDRKRVKSSYNPRKTYVGLHSPVHYSG